MAKRLIDGRKLYNEPWDSITRDVFYWLLAVGADSLGMQPERPATIGEALGLKTSQVLSALSVLTSSDKPCIIRYQDNGRTFLVFRKWQDYQHMSFKVEPTCPQPPDDILERLSDKTSQLLVSSYSVTDEESTGLARAHGTLVSVPTITPVSTKKNSAAKSPQPALPGCSWCNNPTSWESDSPPSQRIMQAYHDGYRARQTNGKEPECPVIGKDSARAWRDLKAMLDAGKTDERVRDVILHGLKSENEWIIGQGYSLVAILSNYQGIAEALDGNKHHGSQTRGSSGASDKRHNSTPREEFPRSGKYNL
jgi:hypothetical protein